jgi:Tfp pilus assembly protein PilF
MCYYLDKIKYYLISKGEPYIDITKKKCIKLVFNLLIHNKIPKEEYNNFIWYFYLGYYYSSIGDIENMLKYYKMAIDKGNSSAMNNLGNYYSSIGDIENMLKYYKMAIDKGNSIAMNNLGYYYNKKGDIENMLKYYTMAIDKGNSIAMNNLGNYYNKKGDIENMLKYYKMAIDKGNINAMTYLGYYYSSIGDIENMLKYYTMAIDKGYNIGTDSILYLFIIYSKLGDTQNMLKYILMNIDNLYLTNYSSNLVKSKDFKRVKLLVDYLVDNFNYDVAIKILPYLKLTTRITLNKYILENNIPTSELHECYVCYDNNLKSCLKSCKCNRFCMCIECYIKHPKCVLCEN